MQKVNWKVVAVAGVLALTLVGALITIVVIRGAPAVSSTTRHAVVDAPAASHQIAADAGGWCTAAEAERADVHHRGAIGDRMPAVMGFMNLSARLDVQHEPIGWRVIREEGDLCAVDFLFRAGDQVKHAQFGLFRRPTPHLVPTNAEAGDITDMFDLWVLGVQLQGQRPQRGDRRLELASELRGRREEFPGANDFYVDHPDSTSLVMESDSCGADPTPMPRNIASEDMARAGFARVICLDARRQVPHDLPSSSRRHRR